MRITLSARSKILLLIEPESSFRIAVTGDAFAGKHVDLIPNAELTESDVTICTNPSVIVDLNAYSHLAGHSIDYDYNTDEFIISDRGRR